MADKKISELDLALLINNDAVFPMSQDNAGEPTTFKVGITQLGTKIAEDMTFSNLRTTSKKLIGAINELLSLGSPIIIGTTAPTSSIGADKNLYIQYTEGTGGADDEVDGIFVKINGAWCEIETGGGGGAGGHTIVDNAGTSLTQRTNLQFIGAYSEDNSTDDTTEVNVVREMTKAEFDELPEEEKTGLINITDITGGNDDRFQPVIYSEEEREIGVWIDGKPLYEKTIDFGALPNNTTKSVPHNISNLDMIAFFNGVAYKSGDTIPIPFSHSSDVSNQPQLSMGNINITIRTANDQSDRIGYITVRYTKTTDQAGSGQWTPQGVPAVHYSEDEQVVGTWIDGSTLYEKTIYNDNFYYPTTGTWADIATISGISKLISRSATISNSAKTSYQDFNYNPSNQKSSKIRADITTGKIQFISADNWGTSTVGAELIVTIRYTKSV